MLRRFTLPTIAAITAVSMVATPALAAQTDQEIDQTVATYDSLVDIVTAEVASAYSGVITTINDLVTGAVNSAIGNPQAVLNLATPLLKASIKGAIGQYIQDDRIDAVIDAAVERIATSTLMEVVLTNEFVQAVLQRTVRYAVADIVASLGLDADQQATTDSLVSTVWTAPRVTVGTAPTKVKSNLGSPIYTLGLGVNTSYYTYNITAWNQKRVLIANVNDTPKEIQVTGWNNGNIRLLAQGVSVVNAGSKADTVVTTLANLDYFSILLSAGSRALFDEVAERVQAALDSLKPQLLTGLSEGLAGLGINLTLNPADSWIAIGGQIAQTLRDSAGNLLDEALSRLPSVIPVDLFSLDRLRELWSGGVNLADLLGTIGGGVNLTDLLGAITGAGVDLTDLLGAITGGVDLTEWLGTITGGVDLTDLLGTITGGSSNLTDWLGAIGGGGSNLTGWLGGINWLSLFRGNTSTPTGPSLTLTADRTAMTNTTTPVLTLVAKDNAGVVLPGAPQAATYTYSYGNSCQFPTGEAPSRRTCTVTATYNGLTARASIEVFDPSALSAPIGGTAIPGSTLSAQAPSGWPTVKFAWTRNGTQFSTASTYKLPSKEALGNVIGLTRTMTYQGLTISGTAPAVTVAVGGAASLAITPKVKAISNAGGVEVTAVAKDALKNVIPAGATDTVYTYSLGEGCSFPTGVEPSRRTCTITGTYGGVSATTTVEVFDPSALAGAISGDPIPGSKLTAGGPEGWPSITREWTRDGKKFSTASTYKLPSSEKLGNVIGLTRTLKYQGLTISGNAPALTVGVGAAASLAITPKAKAITNAGGVEVTAVAKDALKNVIPAGATDTVYTYSLGEGCSFPTGQAPSRRTCTITGTYGGVSATTTVEVFDPSALAGAISGDPAPGSKLTAGGPEGWPSITREWTRNGKKFSTASTYKLPSSEALGNVIVLTRTLKYQGLTISGTSPELVVAR